MWNLRIHYERRQRAGPGPAAADCRGNANPWPPRVRTGVACAEGTVHTFKRPGPATANLGDLNACRGATAIIGHCRWATHGRPEDNRNNHPHPAGRGWFVHNGVVQNHASLARRYDFNMTTECDSEVLGLLMARFPGALGLRLPGPPRWPTVTWPCSGCGGIPRDC